MEVPGEGGRDRVSTMAYIAVMAAVTYAIRAIPMTLFRKPVKNRFVKSFLYYVPYVTLAVMTFPAILDASGSRSAGLLALGVGVALLEECRIVCNRSRMLRGSACCRASAALKERNRDVFRECEKTV